MSKRSPPPLTR